MLPTLLSLSQEQYFISQWARHLYSLIRRHRIQLNRRGTRRANCMATSMQPAGLGVRRAGSPARSLASRVPRLRYKWRTVVGSRHNLPTTRLSSSHAVSWALSSNKHLSCVGYNGQSGMQNDNCKQEGAYETESRPKTWGLPNLRPSSRHSCQPRMCNAAGLLVVQ